MANKRIELEQYKCYVNLFEEEPNRKNFRSGVATAMVAATLLVVLFFVLGLLSGSLVNNPKNVLEKPPAPATTPSGTTPGVTIPGQEGQQLPPGVNIPGQEGGQLPSEVNIPVQQGGQQLPQGIPQPGGAVPLGAIDSLHADFAGAGPSLPAGAGEGALLAQAEPSATPVQAEPTLTPAAPGSNTPASTAPTEAGKKPKKAPPPKQTTGVGNLSNLATKVGGRGFQIYMLFFTVVLGVVIYLTLKRAKKEGKAR